MKYLLNKKFIASAILLACIVIGVKAQTSLYLSKTVTSIAVTPVFTNRVNLLSVTIVSGNNSVIELFDAITNAPYNGTNYVLGAYTTKATAQSNIVTSYIQADTGITNWYTNAGLFTYLVTNSAATNQLVPFAVLVGGAQPTTYPMNALLENGISMRNTTNANVIFNYNYGR